MWRFSMSRDGDPTIQKIDDPVRIGSHLGLVGDYQHGNPPVAVESGQQHRHHTVDQQLCRWLLISFDRLPSNELRMTQELIANMLGVRREGVTEAAGKLQTAGLIRYSRGLITVLDRTGLEARVCECYAVVRKETERLLPEANRD